MKKEKIFLILGAEITEYKFKLINTDNYIDPFVAKNLFRYDPITVQYFWSGEVVVHFW